MTPTPARRRTLAILVLAAIAGLNLAGCGTTYRETYKLDHPRLARGLAVDVENFRGGVELRVDPNVEEILIDRAVHVSGSIDKTQRPAIAEGVDVIANVDEAGGFAVLRVRTLTARPDSEDHHVNLKITVPRCDGVRIENAYGLVEAVDVGGAIEIHNRKGAIEVRTGKPINSPVTLTTVDAHIYYQVPGGSSGRFDLQTLEGVVRFVDRKGESDEVYGSTMKEYSGSLNGGGPPIIARTNKGDVRVWIMDDPVALTRMIHKAPRDPREYLFLKGSRRYTRNLPEDHPEVQAGTRSDPWY